VENIRRTKEEHIQTASRAGRRGAVLAEFWRIDKPKGGKSLPSTKKRRDKEKEDYYRQQKTISGGRAPQGSQKLGKKKRLNV